MWVLGPQLRPCARVWRVTAEPCLQPHDCIEWICSACTYHMVICRWPSFKNPIVNVCYAFDSSPSELIGCVVWKEVPSRSEILLMHSIKVVICRIYSRSWKARDQTSRCVLEVCLSEPRSLCWFYFCLLATCSTMGHLPTLQASHICHFWWWNQRNQVACMGSSHISSVLVMAIDGGLSFTVSAF